MLHKEKNNVNVFLTLERLWSTVHNGYSWALPIGNIQKERVEFEFSDF